MKGLLITFEGVEGSGKSTQAKMLHDRLKNKNIRVLLTREPGYGSLGVRIRDILLSVNSKPIDSQAELFLLLADRAQHVSYLIQPALKNGTVVICDRYIDSSVAYQGYGRGIPVKMIKYLNRCATKNIVPDLTFIMDMDVEISLKRSQSRLLQQDMFKSEGRFESEELIFHQRVREGYQQIARLDPSRCVVINGENDPGSIADQIFSMIDQRLEIIKVKS